MQGWKAAWETQPGSFLLAAVLFSDHRFPLMIQDSCCSSGHHDHIPAIGHKRGGGCLCSLKCATQSCTYHFRLYPTGQTLMSCHRRCKGSWEMLFCAGWLGAQLELGVILLKKKGMSIGGQLALASAFPEAPFVILIS